jgi:hypothetical protein
LFDSLCALFGTDVIFLPAFRWEREPEKRVEEPIYVPSAQPQKRVSKFGAKMKSKLPPVEPPPRVQRNIGEALLSATYICLITNVPH